MMLINTLIGKWLDTMGGAMATWEIELMTNDYTCNMVTLEAKAVEKLDYQTLVVDGVKWALPRVCGMSFASIEKVV